MKKEEWSNQNKLSFSGSGKTIRKKYFSAVKAAVIALLLTLFPSVLSASPLDIYVIGGKGEFQCFPPEDKTPCKATTDDPEFLLLSQKIFGRCQKWALDPYTREKYHYVLQGLIIPGVGLKLVVAYFISEGIDDLAQCILGGLLEYAGYSEKAIDSLLKTTFALKNVADLGSKLKTIDPDDKLKMAELAIEPRDRSRDIEEIMQDEGILSLNEIKTFKQFYHEYLRKGVIGQTKNRLEEAEQKMTICQFIEAEKMINNAEVLVKSYCVERGKEY
jgi:hypothetical protein